MAVTNSHPSPQLSILKYPLNLHKLEDGNQLKFIITAARACSHIYTCSRTTAGHQHSRKSREAYVPWQTIWSRLLCQRGMLDSLQDLPTPAHTHTKHTRWNNLCWAWQIMCSNTNATYKIPYSKKISWDKTFANFVVLHKIWGRGIFWCQQWEIRKSLPGKNLFSINSWKLSPTKVSRYMVTCKNKVYWSITRGTDHQSLLVAQPELSIFQSKPGERGRKGKCYWKELSTPQRISYSNNTIMYRNHRPDEVQSALQLVKVVEPAIQTERLWV